jgi:hypothetical protein
MMTVQAMLQAAVALAALAVPPAPQPARPVPRLAILGGKVLTVTRGTLEGAAVLSTGSWPTLPPHSAPMTTR